MSNSENPVSEAVAPETAPAFVSSPAVNSGTASTEGGAGAQQFSSSALRGYLANPWIAGAVGGVAVILVLTLVTLILPVRINFPIIEQIFIYIMVMGAGTVLIPLAASLLEQKFSTAPTYLTVAVPAAAAYLLLCFVVSAVVNPRLEVLRNASQTSGGGMFTAGLIPVLVFAFLAHRDKMGILVILGLIATFFQFIPALILGGMVWIAWKFVRSSSRNSGGTMTREEAREAYYRDNKRF